MKKNVFRGLTGLMAVLLVLSIMATQICNLRESFLNGQLGTSSYKLVETGCIPAYHIGRLIRIRKSDLIDSLAAFAIA